VSESKSARRHVDIRIATYNIHRCRGMDRRTMPSRVAEVIRATGQARTGFLINPAPEELREILGSRFLDTFFQLLDPEGEPGRRSLRLSGPLPLSADARRNAARHVCPSWL